MKIPNNVKITLSLLLFFILMGCGGKKYKAIDAVEYARGLFKTYESLKRVSSDEEFNNFTGAYDFPWGPPMTEFKRGALEYHKGNFEKSLKNHRKALNIVKNYSEKNSKLKALKEGLPGPIYFYGFAFNFMALQNSDSAKIYFEKAKKEFKNLEFWAGLSDYHVNFGSCPIRK